MEQKLHEESDEQREHAEARQESLAEANPWGEMDGEPGRAAAPVTTYARGKAPAPPPGPIGTRPMSYGEIPNSHAGRPSKG